MVLPLIIGSGVTIVALTLRSGLRAWTIYKSLSPITIARMNNIRIQQSQIQYPWKFQSTQLPSDLKRQLDQYQGGFYERMSEPEALLILNISAKEVNHLDEKFLNKKHRKAMYMNHPDKGGSPYLAIKINEAKDVLMHSVLLRKR
ncbi:Mdj2p NDAI_0G01360 [Naumovozyma dairenensis CBS 421]|uniref:J domain-containing protein n=1 Tax=Naumovozyma dairenensis (strain ATCC 10597 / BCRC 20456 / CBS 421 / NBRC 0211 / NRRL Y-12639) TaxID=1071378 RepID=G0WDQ1_NAUDC|nr:hypothetical protein NDAI_0G01360 [Naumovozyma dairenensis CBS 421]CCD25912.2 hypothetical protein NDAI_0G01360 [Naumovozyma dairenensis CBS 421]